MAEILIAVGMVALALATVPLAVATVFLAIAAWKQLPILNAQLISLSRQIEESQKSEASAAKRHTDLIEAENNRQIEAVTLRICAFYDTDPVLHEACRRIWEASDGGTKYKNNPGIKSHDVITVGNYLDGIALGVLQGLYSDKIAQDHLGPIVKKFVDVILPDTVSDPDGYEGL